MKDKSKDTITVSADETQTGESQGLTDFLGGVLKQRRLAQHLTIQDVADLCDISRGMLSRIENGQAAPSLDTLHRICRSMGISMSNLFKDFDVPDGGARYVPRGEGMVVVRRGTRRGHSYELLAYDQGPKKLFEPFLITLDDESEVFPRFQHEGTEFIYMLEGELEYRVGKHSHLLSSGDALTFQGNIPHGPEALRSVPIRFLSVIHYSETDERPARRKSPKRPRNPR
ncbi:MAG: XRE family transcriptional regulator [Gammaproteobacteria bacterium]|nr:XRE family transcriptional regulator [Gammaproteobacteria bacterium]